MTKRAARYRKKIEVSLHPRVLEALKEHTKESGEAASHVVEDALIAALDMPWCPECCGQGGRTVYVVDAGYSTDWIPCAHCDGLGRL